MDHNCPRQGAITLTGRDRFWLSTLLGAAFTMESATQAILRRDRNYVAIRTNACTICTHNIETAQRMVVLCGHTFHRFCVVVWMRTYGYCPDCPR
ncbi:uncharacterized protein LOC128273960 [Anopheles cruzii]|uniref:uncharacterized protein LOC128273960 n=1 Tax=Anopheles cruzii TaxID=68878 RepID=UPI0022EC5C47|nr:uncharacterized protein LOC128273960 [Anopheles cruzii]